MAQNNPPSTTDQTGGSAATPSTSPQDNSATSGANTGGAAAPAGTNDQGTNAAGTDNTGNAGHKKGGNLPQTASPLPLLGLLGLGSTGLGLIASRKRRS